MARTTTANYETERIKRATAPVYIARFYHVKTYGDGTDYAFSRDFATATVASPTVTKLLSLGRPRGNTQTVEPELGRSSNGVLELRIQDTNGETLRYLSNVPLTLNGAHTSGVTTITITGSTSGYPAVGTIEITTSGTIERVRYTGTTATTFTGCTRGVDGTTAVAHNSGDAVGNGEQIRAGQRVKLFAGYSPLAEADYMSFVKMEVTEVRLLPDLVTFVVSASDIIRTLRRMVFLAAAADTPFTATVNPITFALQVLTSTGAGTNGSYDVLAAENGAAIPQALIDVAGMEALRTSDFPSETFAFRIPAMMDLKQFFEVEVCKALNCYPFVTADGKLSMKRYKLVVGSPTADVFLLTESNIVSWQWVAGYSRIINVVKFDYDFDIAGAKAIYGTRRTYTQQASVDRYGRRQPLVIQSLGVKTANGGAAITADRALQVVKRFAEPPHLLQVVTFYQKHPLEAGDQVKVTHSKIPNLKTGARGLTTEVFEILNVTPQFGGEGRVLLDLLWVGGLPTVSAPSDGGAVSTPTAQEPITFQDTTLTLGPEVAGFAWVHGATFGATTPKNSYRTAIPRGLFTYTVQTGDRLEYDIGFSASSVDTRGGLDLAAIERSNTAQSATATTLRLDTGASASDDAYNNMYLEITSAGNAAAIGQVRKVNDYTGSTKDCAVDTWTTTPTGTITYALRRVLRNESGVVDNENGLGASPATQLGSRALGQWYHRTIPLPSAWVGKVIDAAGTGLDNNASGAVELRITNARITSSAGALRFLLQVAGFTAQGAWAFGTEQNVTGVTIALDSGALAVPTQGLGLLSVGRAAVYRQTATNQNTGAEAVSWTITNFVFIASDNDAAIMWFKGILRCMEATGTASATATVRVRRGPTTAGTEIIRFSVTNPGTKGASSTVSSAYQVFDVDVNAAAGVAPGYQTYCITLALSGSGQATLEVPKLMALVKSR